MNKKTQKSTKQNETKNTVQKNKTGQKNKTVQQNKNKIKEHKTK